VAAHDAGAGVLKNFITGAAHAFVVDFPKGAGLKPGIGLGIRYNCQADSGKEEEQVFHYIFLSKNNHRLPAVRGILQTVLELASGLSPIGALFLFPPAHIF
jgi:hypothetical protein